MLLLSYQHIHLKNLFEPRNTKCVSLKQMKTPGLQVSYAPSPPLKYLLSPSLLTHVPILGTAMVI